MNLGQLRGVIPAVVTPFGLDGSVNYQVLEQLADHLTGQGVHGIMATGGTGEFPHLSDEERFQATRAIVSGADGRVPVIAGTAACTTRDVLRLAEHAAEAGAAAIISVPPFYFPLPDTALADFFTSLADNSPLPVFIYNNPLYTGNPLSPPLLAELLQHPRIAGLKHSGTDLGELVEVIYQIRFTRELDKCLMTGIDSQLCGALAAGADGIFSTAACVAPRQVVEIFALVTAGDIMAARAAQLRMQPLNRFLEYDPGYVGPAKEALRLLGFEVGYPRPPLPGLDAGQRERLRQALARLGMLTAVAGESS